MNVISFILFSFSFSFFVLAFYFRTTLIIDRLTLAHRGCRVGHSPRKHIQGAADHNVDMELVRCI